LGNLTSLVKPYKNQPQYFTLFIPEKRSKTRFCGFVRRFPARIALAYLRTLAKRIKKADSRRLFLCEISALFMA
jgi:hypothetical protein